MMALLKQQQPLQSLGTTLRPLTSTVPYQPPFTLTLLDNDLVAVPKSQQGSQYLNPTPPHPRMYGGFQIPVTGEYTVVMIIIVPSCNVVHKCTKNVFGIHFYRCW